MVSLLLAHSAVMHPLGRCVKSPCPVTEGCLRSIELFRMMMMVIDRLRVDFRILGGTSLNFARYKVFALCSVSRVVERL